MHLLAKLARRPLEAAAVAAAVVVLAQLNIGSAAAAPMAGSSGLLAAVGGTNYLNSVAQDGPSNLWRLNETSGTTSLDSAGTDNLTVDGSATRGATGPLTGESSLATTFSGTASVPAATSRSIVGPQSFSLEAWFKTTSTTGGKIIGFGNSRTENSTDYDRHLYMTNTGSLIFGVYPTTYRYLSSPAGYNNGQWHHVVGSLSASGMDLFVDGRRVARDTSTAGAELYSGYWRVGGDNLTNWPGTVTKAAFTGSLADVAVYPTALSLAQAKAHYAAAGKSTDAVTAPTDSYGAAVVGDTPSIYWRLNETSGSTAKDEVSGDPQSAAYTSGVVLGEPGSSAAPDGKSIRLPGSSAQSLGSAVQVVNPTSYSLETWFKSTSTQGGRLIGFGNARTGLSSTFDRHVYLLDTGRLRYSVNSGQTTNVDSPQSYNDGQWHHVVATQGSGGAQLFVDGTKVASSTAVATQSYTGYWRLGTDNVGSGASSASLAGSLDEAAIYPSVLSSAAVQQHYNLGRPIPPNVPPTAAFSSSVAKLKVSFDAAASTDSDGTIASYAWDFGDGSSGTGVSPSHTYPATGSYPVVLVVKDNQNATTLVQHDVTVTANAAPAAAFGSECADLVCAFDAARSTDADGTIAGYAWNFGDGGSATGATANHEFGATGRYDVVLTVTDDDGATNAITQTVSVAARNNPPTAVLTAECADLDCVFDGTGSTDSDGQIASYAWDFGDGQSGTADRGRHGYTEPGQYTATLTVTDDRGATGTASIVVTAVAPNQPPVASFAAACTDLVCAFDAGRAVDPDGSVTGYAWDFGDGSTGSGVTPSHTYAAGSYSVTLTVTDDDGATDTITRPVTAVEPNKPPVAVFTAKVTDLSAAFDAAGSTDSDGQIASYAWTFGDGETGTGVSPTHTYRAGSYSVTLTVTDDDGATDTTTRAVTAVEPNKPPVARFSSKVTNLSAAFDAAGSTDSDGQITSYAWHFGDGASATGVSPTHKYAAAGVYSVSVTVTDDDGATDTAKADITATDPIIAADTFSRTVASGLGTADTGGAWTTTGVTGTYSVADGSARLAIGGSRAATLMLPSVSSLNVDLTNTTWLEQAASTSGSYLYSTPRSTSSGDYRVKVKVVPNASLTLQIVRTTGTSDTALTAQSAVPDLTLPTGTKLRVRVQAFGSSPTTIRARIWLDGGTEPTTWQASVTDSTAGLQQAGGVGLGSYLSGSFSSAVARWDDLAAFERNELVTSPGQ
jgi:PKD repeat protein